MAPGKHNHALIIIDCINDLEFDGGKKILPWAERLADRLVRFRSQARKANVPVIYANDNYNIWKGGFQEIFKKCTARGVAGRDFSRKLKPGKEDFVILKPRHSAFFSTPLIQLLEHLKVRHLILTGISTNLCLLFTAHDAHMHGYPFTVLSDCSAAESDFDHNTALQQLKSFCRAKICLSSEFDLSRTRTKAIE